MAEEDAVPAGSAEPPTPRLVEIQVYPLKSAAGIARSSVEVDESGLRHDRQWMLLDDSGQFLSQRTHPRMALLRTALEGSALRLSAPDLPPFELPLDEDPGAHPVGPVRVWHTDRYALDCGAAAAEWASTFMELSCRVVRAAVPADGACVSAAGFVRAGFADAEPALVVSTASLDDLNARLTEPLPMNRFRPNLVVSGMRAYEEDGWGPVRIGEVPARGSRRCPRCSQTTVDQRTGVKGVEPLRTLATYRRMDDGEVGFGMNLRFEGAGTLRVGDPVVT